MILTSHRLDCLQLNLALLERNDVLRAFDRVVFLLNGVEPHHRAAVDAFMRKHPGVQWDTISGPRGRAECISALENRCVEKYPDAVYVKIDEDIFVPRGWAERMFAAYEAHKDDMRLALITPLIPNNAYGLWSLLKEFDPEGLAEFTLRFACEPSPEIQGATWRLPSVAEWAIRRYLDLEAANAAQRERVPEASPARYRRFTDRFSIGCILFNHRHWKAMGGIPPKDEPEWCEWIERNGCFNVLDTHQIVQHYSFFVQQDWLDRTTALEDLAAVNLGRSQGAIARHLPRLMRTAAQVPSILKRRLGRGD